MLWGRHDLPGRFAAALPFSRASPLFKIASVLLRFDDAAAWSFCRNSAAFNNERARGTLSGRREPSALNNSGL